MLSWREGELKSQETSLAAAIGTQHNGLRANIEAGCTTKSAHRELERCGVLNEDALVLLQQHVRGCQPHLHDRLNTPCFGIHEAVISSIVDSPQLL